MQKDTQEKGVADKAGLPTPTVAADQRAGFHWPWGIVALGIMAIAWVGVYLMWNGVIFLFQL